MDTAFQPDAFQADAFQIVAAGFSSTDIVGRDGVIASISSPYGSSSAKTSDGSEGEVT